jgi:hypothetical protein
MLNDRCQFQKKATIDEHAHLATTAIIYFFLQKTVHTPLMCNALIGFTAHEVGRGFAACSLAHAGNGVRSVSASFTTTNMFRPMNSGSKQHTIVIVKVRRCLPEHTAAKRTGDHATTGRPSCGSRAG